MDKYFEKIKLSIIAVFTAVTSFLGALAIPVYLLLATNIIDYLTGRAAAPYRGQNKTSTRGYEGIQKKASMWVLVVMGVVVDIVLAYGTYTIGGTFKFRFIFAIFVAIWLTCNEVISILENVADMGIKLPSFLLKIVSKIKSTVEDGANANIEGNKGIAGGKVNEENLS